MPVCDSCGVTLHLAYVVDVSSHVAMTELQVAQGARRKRVRGVYESGRLCYGCVCKVIEFVRTLTDRRDD